MDLSDCKACHAADKKSIGPSYADLGKKYKASAQNIDMLAKKIINGGGGVWGEQAMAAHPQIPLGDAKEIVTYILSLSDKKKASKPVVGEYVPQDKGKAGTYLFAASYTDKGAGKLAPATGQKVVALRNPTIKAVDFDQVSKGSKYKVDGLGEVLAATGDKGFAKYNGIDLTGIKNISFMGLYMQGQTSGGILELRTGSPTGNLVGSAEINASKKFNIPVNVLGIQDLYFVFVNPKGGDGALFGLKDFLFEN
jgi:cytochrome c